MKVIFYAVQTINGKIAHAPDERVTWSSKEDKHFFHEETKKCGVVIMGHTTYKTVGMPLPGRLNIVLTRHPEQEKSKQGVLEFTDKPLREIVSDCAARGFTSVAVTGGASIYSQFLEEGLADELMITIEPKIFGRGIGIFADMKNDFSLKLLDIRKLSSQTFVLHYKVIK